VAGTVIAVHSIWKTYGRVRNVKSDQPVGMGVAEAGRTLNEVAGHPVDRPDATTTLLMPMWLMSASAAMSRRDRPVSWAAVMAST
jgi:hypothetical protein